MSPMADRAAEMSMSCCWPSKHHLPLHSTTLCRNSVAATIVMIILIVIVIVTAIVIIVIVIVVVIVTFINHS